MNKAIWYICSNLKTVSPLRNLSTREHQQVLFFSYKISSPISAQYPQYLYIHLGHSSLIAIFIKNIWLSYVLKFENKNLMIYFYSISLNSLMLISVAAWLMYEDTNLILDMSESTSWTFGVNNSFPGGSSSFLYMSILSFSNWGGSLTSITFTVMFTESANVPWAGELSLQTNKGSSFSTPICRLVKVVRS